MRHAEPGARVADEVAGREVVGAVDDDVVVGDEVEHVVGDEPLRDRPHLDLGREEREGLHGGVDLGAPDVGDAVHHLALEVRRLDDVVVDHGETADAGCREVEEHRRAQPAGTHDEDPGRPQPALSLRADPREDDVAGEARPVGR